MVPIALNRSIIDNSPLDPPEPPHVTPSYYAGILVNSLIGNSGSAKVTELPVPDENVSGYAVYEGNTLKRAVFVNLHAWLLSSTGVRPSVHIDLFSCGGATVDDIQSAISHISASDAGWREEDNPLHVVVYGCPDRLTSEVPIPDIKGIRVVFREAQDTARPER